MFYITHLETSAFLQTSLFARGFLGFMTIEMLPQVKCINADLFPYLLHRRKPRAKCEGERNARKLKLIGWVFQFNLIIAIFGPRFHCTMPRSSSFNLTAYFHQISMNYERWLDISNVFTCMSAQLEAGIIL